LPVIVKNEMPAENIYTLATVNTLTDGINENKLE
jgi:hypothetical protein